MEETNVSMPENKKSLSPFVIVGVFAVLGIVAFFVIWKGGGKNQTPVEAPLENQNNTAIEASGPIKEFTVDGSSYEFDPKTISVKKGDTVKITFRDNDSRHNLVIDGYNVETDVIGKGKEDTIQFVADRAGSFEYYCSVANHREQGMTGTLIVEEGAVPSS